ncbi:FAD-dependent oxidoreductase [Halioxenophilus sp. WMMB6]|uniref:FAD-dependent oxidoreductase n=1 Tax=Halioxenophilus sp. WMMB6 TaxID=3073815 RepID=UPI00295E2B9D|nr:FAD-dependent oxidoreductase [Halioxenophilus sp. WMMB6]
MTLQFPAPVTLRDHYDIVVIGGGINGTAVARAAAGRGLHTLLCQAQDLATGYSSDCPYFLSGNLTNLRKFRLGKLAKSYRQLEKLEDLAPHLMHPCQAIESHPKHWLWPLLDPIYKLWRHAPAKMEVSPGLLPSKNLQRVVPGYRVMDFRFTLANATQAQELGAHIATHHQLLSGHRDQGLWQLSIQTNQGFATTKMVTCPILINATGPFVQQVLNSHLQSETRAGVKLQRMTHLVLANRLQLNNAIFYNQAGGQRLALVPINERWLHFGPLINDSSGELNSADIESDRETLLQILKELSGHSFLEGEIAQCRCGLRAISDDGTSEDLSDLVLDLDCPDGQSPLVNMLGGDLLHHRINATQTLRLLQPYLPKHAHALGPILPLPGGDITSPQHLAVELAKSYPHLPTELLTRLQETYGEAAFEILGQAKSVADLGLNFGHHLHEAEVAYLVEREWATTAADILERRTGLSWDFTAAEAQALADYLEQQRQQV